MEDSSIDSLYKTSARLVRMTTTDFHRYLYDQINWDNWLIAIKGTRGVGKTTMMLQRIKENFADNPDKALYVSLDNLWFANHSMSEVVEYHYNHGGTHLFIDEVHKYPLWQTLIKNITDEYPDLHVVFTGSSMLKIDSSQGDLSRRLLDYTLHVMSFREFLSFEGAMEVSPIPFSELLTHHAAIAMRLTSDVKILPLFEKYLKYGCYPFYKRDFDGFGQRLQKAVHAVLYEDVPAVEEITYPTILKLSRMLMILAEHVPQTPKMNELYAILETNREQGMKLLYMLQRAGLLHLLSTETKEFGNLVKPDKIFLYDPNMMYALGDNANIGTVRETFFINQLSAITTVNYPRKGDFLVNHKHLFEVGGKGKKFDQIKDVPDSYLAVDDTEIGHGNRVPLWMFGVLY